MRSRFPILIAFVLLTGGLRLAAKDFWENPYSQWAQKDVNKMLQDSPWTLAQTYRASEGAGRGGAFDRTSSAGERENNSIYTIRLFSSQPIRDAYARMMQLMNRYDSASDAEKQRIDAMTSKVRTLDVSERIIVAMVYSSNLPDNIRNFKQFFDKQSADLLKQNCYLISSRLGRVELKEFWPESPDGSGMKFIFPRTVNGQPVFQESDKELRFDMWVEPTSQKIFQAWKPKNLVYQGKLSF
jgi:hypothetical protein